MSATFVLEKESQKQKFFLFLKDRYFVMSGAVDMNVGVF